MNSEKTTLHFIARTNKSLYDKILDLIKSYHHNNNLDMLLEELSKISLKKGVINYDENSFTFGYLNPKADDLIVKIKIKLSENDMEFNKADISICNVKYDSPQYNFISHFPIF